MKLASLKTGGRDGSLIVVSRNLKHYVTAKDISPTLQTALDDWQQTAPRLNAGTYTNKVTRACVRGYCK